VAELLEMFADLPPVDTEQFDAYADRCADSTAYFDAYERARLENA